MKREDLTKRNLLIETDQTNFQKISIKTIGAIKMEISERIETISQETKKDNIIKSKDKISQLNNKTKNNKKVVH